MQEKIKQILARRSLPVIWTIIIFILMAIPGKMLPSEETTFIPNFDKIIHLSLFGGFVFFWAYYYWVKMNRASIPHGLIFRLVIVASLYGTATEFMQKYLIPNRDYSIFDIMADVAGAIIGGLVAELVMSRYKAVGIDIK